MVGGSLTMHFAVQTASIEKKKMFPLLHSGEFPPPYLSLELSDHMSVASFGVPLDKIDIAEQEFDNGMHELLLALQSHHY